MSAAVTRAVLSASFQLQFPPFSLQCAAGPYPTARFAWSLNKVTRVEASVFSFGSLARLRSAACLPTQTPCHVFVSTSSTQSVWSVTNTEALLRARSCPRYWRWRQELDSAPALKPLTFQGEEDTDYEHTD